MSGKPSIVIFSCKNLESAYYRTNFLRLSLLLDRPAGTKLIYLTPRKDTDRVRAGLYKHSGVLVDKVYSYANHLGEEIFADSAKFQTWGEYLENKDLFAPIGEVSDIVIAGGLLFTSNGFDRPQNALAGCLGNSSCMRYVSVSSFLAGMLQLSNLQRRTGARIHECLRDPLENTLSHTSLLPASVYRTYFDYSSPSYGFQRLDGFQHWLSRRRMIANPYKSLDLVFGFSVITDQRMGVYNRYRKGAKSMRGLTAKEFIRNKFTGEDTFIDREEYLKWIRLARYTIIIPSYDIRHFSSARFMESLANDCLPLIAEDCQAAEFAQSFGLDSSCLQALSVSYDRVGDKIKGISESQRSALLATLKEAVLQYKWGYDFSK